MENPLKDFYVIAVINNPARYARRPQLFKEFMSRMAGYGVNLFVVETAFGERDFQVTDAANPRHIRLQSDSELWHKENMINIGISRLPADWKYVAWIDGDIDFVRADWAIETVHELQHHDFVQLFSDAIDMGPNHEVLTVFKSFAYCYCNKLPPKIAGKQYRKAEDYDHEGFSHEGGSLQSIKTKDTKNYSAHNTWHPGYAWAATRQAITAVGGLIDFAILGSADFHMATAIIGNAAESLPPKANEEYKKMVLNWQARAAKLGKNIGYVKGTIYHFWHGKKADRRYMDRWDILIKNKFNPQTDIHKDWQGLYVMNPDLMEFQRDIRDYFRARNEDSIDL